MYNSAEFTLRSIPLNSVDYKERCFKINISCAIIKSLISKMFVKVRC